MENRKTNDRQLISLLGGIPELIGDGYRLVQIGAHRKELDRTAHGTPMEGILPHYGVIAIHTGTAGNPDGGNVPHHRLLGIGAPCRVQERP